MTAYYNEIDPYAAQWLRNLIAAGHIAGGEVDERDIRDVRPADLRGYAQCHFFAGIGGWSCAARHAGWPDGRSLWTGSCPCQPFSAAGRRGGFADERHLWPAWQWLIGQCRPSVIFGEQVAASSVGPWIDLVQDDLEGMGYAFGAVPFPAAGIGAPHIRDRMWWVADACGAGSQGRTEPRQRIDAQRTPIERDGATGGMAEPAGAGFQERDGRAHGWAETELERLRGTRAILDALGRMADTLSVRSSRGPGGGPNAGATGGDTSGARQGSQRVRHDAGTSGAGTGRMADTEHRGRTSADGCASKSGRDRAGSGLFDGGDDIATGRISARPLHGFWRDADWLLCRDGKWRPVEPGTFPLAHGVPARVGKLRAYGNAIVVEAAAEFIGAYLDAGRDA